MLRVQVRKQTRCEGSAWSASGQADEEEAGVAPEALQADKLLRGSHEPALLVYGLATYFHDLSAPLQIPNKFLLRRLSAAIDKLSCADRPC